MNPVVTCECGNLFEVETRFAGGIVNCPDCGRAVQVPGLRDPLWRVLQLGACAAVVAATCLAYEYLGIAPAMLTLVGGAALVWLISRAL